MAPSPVDDAVSPPHTSPSPVDDDDLLCFSKSEMNDICDTDFVTSVYNKKMSLSKHCCKAVSKVPEHCFIPRVWDGCKPCFGTGIPPFMRELKASFEGEQFSLQRGYSSRPLLRESSSACKGEVQGHVS
ncbi:hypothetical protein CQW23_00364 [Capsicum baccatum]|uniref:Uncharacterized protein n=1 Tax=Capsicum baccatum TaxID=33114 RepID=A0A2G2XKW4_CAPBA|nr:hypothetical protein CQW23_00364 [Capsicum baccatum]